MSLSNTAFYLLLENLLFLGAATTFLVVVGWAWRHLEPFKLPDPLPEWFSIWFLTVQIVGILPPLGVLLWGAWAGHDRVLIVFLAYFAMLGLQILSEVLTLKKFQTVVWVMVPYLYLPYRIWQLYEGFNLLLPETDLMWVRNLLLIEIILWTLNYVLDLSQLPRLLRWKAQG